MYSYEKFPINPDKATDVPSMAQLIVFVGIGIFSKRFRLRCLGTKVLSLFASLTTCFNSEASSPLWHSGVLKAKKGSQGLKIFFFPKHVCSFLLQLCDLNCIIVHFHFTYHNNTFLMVIEKKATILHMNLQNIKLNLAVNGKVFPGSSLTSADVLV